MVEPNTTTQARLTDGRRRVLIMLIPSPGLSTLPPVPSRVNTTVVLILLAAGPAPQPETAHLLGGREWVCVLLGKLLKDALHTLSGQRCSRPTHGSDGDREREAEQKGQRLIERLSYPWRKGALDHDHVPVIDAQASKYTWGRLS
jgi:hypothetical protein